ncbi:MAG: hypothetical protein JKX85_14695, partial [Phycisphaeraceae bacterium]|nr:hypothetical protein [Phycisphaeraceae bacterium]
MTIGQNRADTARLAKAEGHAFALVSFVSFVLKIPQPVIILAMKTLADSSKIASLVQDLAQQVSSAITASESSHPWAIVGIRSRGDLLAQRLSDQLDPTVISDRFGVLDITLYRDDLSEITHQPMVRTTKIPFDIDGLNIVLVDDVLMTG